MGANDEQQHFELSPQCAPCFLLSSLISTSVPLPLSSTADQSFIICMWLASLTLLSSDPILLVSNLPTHSFLWYWPLAMTALSFFVRHKRTDISKLVFYLSFWIRTAVRNRGSKFWATKGADEHRRLSRRDCQFWAGALNLKIILLLRTSIVWLSCICVILYFLYLRLISVCLK